MNRDADGFLLNGSDWSLEVMEEMARADNFEITEQIKIYIKQERCIMKPVLCRLLGSLQKNLVWIEKLKNYIKCLNLDL